MSQIIRSTIRVHPASEAFSITGDKTLFDKIVADQEKHAGLLRPAKVWDLDIGGHNGNQYFQSQQKGESVAADAYSDNKYYEDYSSLERMLEPLIGNNGLRHVNSDVVQRYLNYLQGIDHLSIVDNYFEPNGEMKAQASSLVITDLGSIIDINIISSCLDPDAEQVRLLEVGGGYGRLAEAFLNVYGAGKIKYVLLDVVPASLMYAYLYLSKNFPALRIGFYYNEDPFDLDLFDCYIMPAWHFDASANQQTFDCCINIQSMQEMNQHHIDYYLDLFNTVLKNGSGIAYLSNEKDYIFQGEWNYPTNWQLLLKTRTPRSWTRNSPTEVFIKGSEPFEKTNRLVDFVYSLQLEELDRNANQVNTISSLQSELQNVQRELEGRRRQVADLQSEFQRQRQRTSDLQIQLQKSRQEGASLQLTLSRMPLASNDLTVEKVEEALQKLYHYYGSKELPAAARLFEPISKINARLVAANLNLREGRYKRTLVHLVRIGMMDPLALFSIQTIRIIGNGLMFRLKQPHGR